MGPDPFTKKPNYYKIYEVQFMFNVLTNKFYLKIMYLFIGLSFATIIADIPYFNLLNKATLAYGMLLIFINIFEVLFFKKRKFYFFELFLYAFLIFTLYLNLTEYKLTENLKVWLVNVMILTVLFSIDTHKKREQLNKEINIISYFIVSYTFILSVGSLILMFYNKNISSIFKFINPNTLGSFAGLFKNENSFGIAATLSLVISLYLLFESRKLLTKGALALNTIVQFISIFISGGRSGYLVPLAIIFVFSFIKYKNLYFRTTIIALPIVTSVVAFFTLPSDILHKILTGREYLWQSAFRLIAKYPLTGVGNVNKVGRIKDVRVTYLLGLEEGGLHNIFFEILCVNGIIATIIFVLLLIFILIFLFKKILKLKNRDRLKYGLLLSLIIGILFINLLESSLIYIISFISIIFWIYTGYLISLLSIKNKTYY